MTVKTFGRDPSRITFRKKRHVAPTTTLEATTQRLAGVTVQRAGVSRSGIRTKAAIASSASQERKQKKLLRSFPGLHFRKRMLGPQAEADRPDSRGADELADADRSTAARLAAIGIQPGTRLDDDQVRQTLAAMTDSAKWATGSSDVARTLLTAADFDGSGLTAEQLVREGRSARVLSRIDDLRFGARG